MLAETEYQQFISLWQAHSLTGHLDQTHFQLSDGNIRFIIILVLSERILDQIYIDQASDKFFNQSARVHDLYYQ